jgi:hypothetical protein
VNRPAPRYVYVPTPRCPSCRSTSYTRQRTERDRIDGGKTHHAKCNVCGARFRIVFE